MEIRKLSNSSNELVSKTESSSLSTISSESDLSELTARPVEDTVVVGNVVIHRSENGLYNLNDLHKASGGDNSLRPAKFFEVAKNSAFLKTLQDLNPDAPVVKTVKGGTNPGTWGSEEVVYKYAAWISNDFDVLVMSTFKKIVRKELEWVHQARLQAIAAHGEEKAAHIRTLGQLKEATKENQDSRLIIRTMEQSVSRLNNNIPESVADYIGLQKQATVDTIFALENAHGVILAARDDADSLTFAVKSRLSQDMAKHWRDFLTKDLFTPLKSLADYLDTKLVEVTEDLTEARSYKVGDSKRVRKQKT